MIETNRRFERIEFTRRGIINSARRKSRLGRGEAHNSSIAGATSFARPRQNGHLSERGRLLIWIICAHTRAPR